MLCEEDKPNQARGSNGNSVGLRVNPRCIRCNQSDAFLSGQPPHSAFEEVECVPNGKKTQAYEIPHKVRSCTDATCTTWHEDRISGTTWLANAKAEPQDHWQQEVSPAASKIRMSSYSTHHLNSATSRIALCSLKTCPYQFHGGTIIAW